MKKWLAVLTACLMVVVLLTACSGSGGPADGSSAPAESASTQSAAPADSGEVAGASGTDKELTFGIVLKTLNNEFFMEIVEGAQAKADELGIKLVVDGPQTEGSTQQHIEIIENIINSGVDGLIIGPQDSFAYSNVVKQANEAGIPVVTFDSMLDADSLAEADAEVVTFIGSDNYRMGQIAGEWAVDYFKDKDSVDVGIVEGIGGQEVAENWKAGFLDAIEGSNINVVSSQTGEFDQEKAMGTAENMIQAYPSIEMIYACNDPMAAGVVEALRGADRLDIKVVGIDGAAIVFPYIFNGELTGSVSQDPFMMGYLSVEACMDALDGKTVEPITYTPSEMITSDNLEKTIRAKEANQGGKYTEMLNEFYG